MSLISIDIDSVRELNESLKIYLKQLSNIKSSVSSERYCIDPAIAARRNIGSRLSRTINELEELETRIRKLSDFINYAMDTYSNVEDRLNRMALDLGTDIGGDKKSSAESEWSAFSEFVKYGSRLSKIYNEFAPYSKLKFKIIERNGKVLFKFNQGSYTYKEYQKLLNLYLGNKSKWSRQFVKKMTSTGITLYDASTKKYSHPIYKKIFSSTRVDGLNRYVQLLGENKIKVYGNTFAKNMKVWNNFTGWKNTTKMVKGAKGLGAVSTLFTLADNWNQSQLIEEKYTGEKYKKFVVDTVVDVSSTAAAMTAGAIAGSFILPPAGTVAGMIVGGAISVAINTKFGDPPNSIVGHTKDIANYAVDKVVDVASDLLDGIGNSISKLFW